jgi:hypothetical protein
VIVDEPSPFWCVVLLLEEEKAPERAPKTFRFNPAYEGILCQFLLLFSRLAFLVFETGLMR